MTWGSHCPQCGREECRWVVGKVCEGNVGFTMPGGYRISIDRRDFGVPGFYFYIEERRKTWYGRTYWRELEDTRGTLREALSKAGYHNPRTPLYQFWLKPVTIPEADYAV